MGTLNVTLIQTDLVWHDPDANRRRLQQHFGALVGKTDLVVLPEMFTTGFTMEAESVAEPANGPAVSWMSEQAAALGAVITGSIRAKFPAHLDADDFHLIGLEP